MGKLTALAARALGKPGRRGNGLYLNITPSGSKSWVQRIVINGRRTDIGLGPYPAVNLARARSIAYENRSAVSEGRDPVIRFWSACPVLTRLRSSSKAMSSTQCRLFPMS